MTISLIAYLHGFGGAERQITELANRLAVLGHEVSLVCVAACNVCYPVGADVRVVDLTAAERGPRCQRIVRRALALRRFLQRQRPDATVHFNYQSVYFLAMPPRRGFGRIVFSERGDPGDKEYTGLLGLVRRLTLHAIDSFVFQSEGAREFFRADPYVMARAAVVPNACFMQGQQPFAGTRRNAVATVGRLSHQKNQALLLQAFAEVVNPIDDTYPCQSVQSVGQSECPTDDTDIHGYGGLRLEVYGTGPLLGELTALAERLGIADRVDFMGNTSHVADAIRGARLFVLSSDFEGIPNALIEAMALGLPCVSTDCRPGGARTLITHGVDGLITPVGDAAALADAMRSLLDDPERAETMGRVAMNIATRLAPDNIYRAWERAITTEGQYDRE